MEQNLQCYYFQYNIGRSLTNCLLTNHWIGCRNYPRSTETNWGWIHTNTNTPHRTTWLDRTCYLALLVRCMVCASKTIRCVVSSLAEVGWICPTAKVLGWASSWWWFHDFVKFDSWVYLHLPSMPGIPIQARKKCGIEEARSWEIHYDLEGNLLFLNERKT